MKANELRIGNLLVYKFGDIVEVKAIHDDTVTVKRVGRTHRIQSIVTDYDKVKPIPLTEGWLKKFGFENGDYDCLFWWIEKNDFKFEISGVWNNELNKHDFGVRYNNQIDVNIQSVHQLQNLYYALTGE